MAMAIKIAQLAARQRALPLRAAVATHRSNARPSAGKRYSQSADTQASRSAAAPQRRLVAHAIARRGSGRLTLGAEYACAGRKKAEPPWAPWLHVGDAVVRVLNAFKCRRA